ncbi:hypothetical protein GCM10027430_12760 [Lysobacter tyrosinilyticus]
MTLFGKLGEIAGECLNKGSQVYVEGSIRYDKYTGQDGVERYSTDIIADEIQMLGGRAEGAGAVNTVGVANRVRRARRSRRAAHRAANPRRPRRPISVPISRTTISRSDPASDGRTWRHRVPVPASAASA